MRPQYSRKIAVNITMDQRRARGKIALSGLTAPFALGLLVFAVAMAGILLRLTWHLSYFWIANAVLLGVLVRYPVFRTWSCGIASTIGFIAADAITGSGWEKSLLLTAANLAGIYAGLSLYLQFYAKETQFQRPACVLHLLVVVAGASFASALAGIVPSVLLFENSPLQGFMLWYVTEFTNYVVIVPLILTVPHWAPTLASLRNLRASFTSAKLAPLALYIVTLGMEPLVEGPGVLAFPIPALLWCAVTYGVLGTTFLTFSFAAWALVVVSFDLIGEHHATVPILTILSLRLGVALAALAPVMVSVVMAAREETLREAAAARAVAESAMASRSLLLATMAHELRSPLNAIIGYAGLMSQQVRGQLGDSRYIEDAQSIELAGRHLAALVTDLLDTAKIEAGNVVLHLAPTSSRDMVEQAIRLVRGMAYDKQIDIIHEAGAWPLVLADDRAIKQVLINLVANAVKFSPAGSTIKITSEIAGARLRIKVVDNGVGISAGELKRLGYAYAQAGDSHTQRKGTGLGLALSCQLIEQHGSCLKLESELGFGTTAAFDLSIAAETA